MSKPSHIAYTARSYADVDGTEKKRRDIISTALSAALYALDENIDGAGPTKAQAIKLIRQALALRAAT